MKFALKRAIIGVGIAVTAVTAPILTAVASPASAAVQCHYDSSAHHATVRYGSVGESVYQLQCGLLFTGYPVYPDGGFGPKTRTAVIKFQRAHHLTADAIVGPKTWAALNAAVRRVA